MELGESTNTGAGGDLDEVRAHTDDTQWRNKERDPDKAANLSSLEESTHMCPIETECLVGASVTDCHPFGEYIGCRPQYHVSPMVV